MGILFFFANMEVSEVIRHAWRAMAMCSDSINERARMIQLYSIYMILLPYH